MVSSIQMTPRERIRAAIAGEPVDHAPISVWRHFPEEDQTAAGLTAATLRWQRTFPADLVKFMPSGDYGTIDWGAQSAYTGSLAGTRQTTYFPIQRATDWLTLPNIEASAGFYREMTGAVRQTRSSLDPDVPLLHTIFSPLTTAMKLSGGAVLQHLAEEPDGVHAALAVIARVTRAHALATLEAGADGFFFATQCADVTVTDEPTYRAFGLRYDLESLAGLAEQAILLLHLHGDRPMFALQGEHPAHILNWHDRNASPTLAEGKAVAGRCVAGGINERMVAQQSPDQTAGDVTDALAQTSGRRVLIAPGCVVPVNTPDAVIRAAFQAAGAI